MNTTPSLRTLPVAAVLLAAALAFAPHDARAQFGVAGGANFDRLSDVEGDEGGYSFDNATGFHVGVFYDFAAGPFGVRPGVYYMDVGSFDANADFDTDPSDPGASLEGTSYDLSLIEVPIDLRYRLSLPLLKPYLTAGPAFRFVADDGDSFSDATSNFSMAGNAGLGTDFGAPTSSISFFVEGRYTFGLSSIASDFEAFGADVTTTVEDDARLNNIMLRAGVKF